MLLPQQPPDGQSPQKLVRKIQRKIVPSGRILELREVEIQWMSDMTQVKDFIYEMEPEAADGSLPKDLAEVNECCVCFGIFHSSNLETCIHCGRHCSISCRIEIPPQPASQEAMILGIAKPQPSKFLCLLCYEKTQETFWDMLRRRFWRL